MTGIDVLIVGPASHRTGGIARYIAEHRRQLPETVRTSVYDTGTPDVTGTTGFLYAVVLSLLATLRFPFRERPDIVHVHSSHHFSFYRSVPYVLIAKYLWQRPVVLHVHGSSFDEFVEAASGPVARVQRLVFSASSRIVVLSEYWRGVLRQRADDDKLVVIPNAIDMDGYEPRFDTEPPHVVFVSNHIERKGIREFVEAVRNLRQNDYNEVRVSIAGDGPLSEYATNLAADDPRTEYLGYIEESEKRRLLSNANIYALPTYAEGLPIALLEGMAGGNAIVSTDVGSIPELLGEDNGYIVPAGDVDALTGVLETLVSNPSRTERMGRTNYTTVTEAYDWNVIGQRVSEMYYHIVSEPALEAYATRAVIES